MHLFMWMLMAHLTGDWLLQTTYQALNKDKGKWWNKALLAHCTVYTLCFLPIFLWKEVTLWWLTTIFVSHVFIDRRWPISWWCKTFKQLPIPVKGAPEKWEVVLVRMMVDQSFHLIIIAIIAELGGK